MKEKQLKIVIIGNSVVLYPVPCRISKEDGVFGELIEKELLEKGIQASVIISGQHGSVITEGLKYIEQNVTRYLPDIVIINYGIVDCTPRLFPKFWVDFVKMESPWPIKNAIKIFLRKITSFITNNYLKLVKGQAWIPVSIFKRAISMMLDRIKKDTMADIILINIPPSTPKRENNIKGLERNIIEYNKAMNELSIIKKAILIDAYGLVKQYKVEEILPEGFHYNTKGHKLIAKKIAEEILSRIIL
jgi:lysophospholipase L1-like esterase